MCTPFITYIRLADQSHLFFVSFERLVMAKRLFKFINMRTRAVFSMKQFNSFIVVLVLAVVLPGCLKKYDPDKLASGSWDPTLATPIAISHFSVYDILDRQDEDDLIVIDPQTGLLALRYSGQAFSFSAAEVLELPPASFSASYNGAADFGFPVSPSFNEQLQASISDSFNYVPENGEQLYQAHLLSGTISVHIETSLQHNLVVQFAFPYITKFGTPLVLNVPVIHTGALSQAQVVVNLADYIIDFTAGGNQANLVAAEVTAWIDGTGNPIQGNEQISASVNLSNLMFSLATGDFGQQSVAADGDSIMIAIFQNSIDGYFELTDPRLRLDITNAFGFPVSVDITELKTVETSTGLEYPMQGFPNPIVINHPSVPGDSVLTQLEFNNQNTSNIAAVINPVPRFLHFAIEGTSNPAGQAVSPNFITNESFLRVDATLEMPLQGFAYGFALRDTVDFEFTEALDEVEWVKIRLNARNGFPLELTGQIYLADENYNVLDTLLSPNQQVLQSGVVNSIGRVIAPTTKITDILIPRERIGLLYETAYLILFAETNTFNATTGEVIGLYETDFLELRLGMQVQARFTY